MFARALYSVIEELSHEEDQEEPVLVAHWNRERFNEGAPEEEGLTEDEWEEFVSFIGNSSNLHEMLMMRAYCREWKRANGETEIDEAVAHLFVEILAKVAMLEGDKGAILRELASRLQPLQRAHGKSEG